MHGCLKVIMMIGTPLVAFILLVAYAKIMLLMGNDALTPAQSLQSQGDATKVLGLFFLPVIVLLLIIAGKPPKIK